MLSFLLSSLLFLNVYSYSACDEVDVTFVIDTDSIKRNSDIIIDFISSIIWSGSSEQTGFSAVVYGDDIPNDLDINLISLDETQSITQRQMEEEKIDDQLQAAFTKIIESNDKATKSVDLLSAFKIGNKQHLPKHSHLKKQRLGYKMDDPHCGQHDDDKVYFIFDHDNKLMFDESDKICALFHHLDVNAIQNDDESIHFLMGQEFIKEDTLNIYCKNKKPDQIKWNTFYEFDEELLYNHDKMEQIFDITCPAIIETPEFNGNVNLGNHVQWIDADTVIKCNLKYYDFHDKTKQDELDPNKSYITVKDYTNDDNTFKKNDFLLANPQIFENMQKLGCTSPVLKIIKIKTTDGKRGKGKKKENEDDYKILKLYVTLPESPMEYLLDANVDGDVPIDVNDQHQDAYNNDNNKYQDTMVSHARIMDDDMMMGWGKKIRKRVKKGFKKVKKRVSSVRKKIKKRVRSIRNKAKKVLSKGKKFLKKGTNKLKKFGKKIVKKAKKVIKKVGKKVKKFAKKVVKTLKKIADKILNMKLQVSGSKKIVDLNFKGDYKWERTKSFNKVYNGPRGMTVTFKGDGTITLKYGYWFKFKVSAYFKFFWQILKGNIHIEFKLHGGWDIGAYFNAKLTGNLQILINNILNWGYTYTFFIGPVPVVIRPYLQLNARLVTIPLEVYGGIRCRYAERFAIGYYYDRKEGKRHPIKERTVIEKGCKKKFGINDKGTDPNECPVAQLGFDIIIEPQIGVLLYYIINIFLKFEFVLPFRITLPEMNPKFCKLPATTDMCAVSKYLRASFTIALNLNIYIGISLDIGKFVSVIKRLFRKKKPKKRTQNPGAQKKIAGPIRIIPKKSLGCIQLKGLLKPLNKHYKSRCCKGSGGGGGGAGGYDNYDNGGTPQIAPPPPKSQIKSRPKPHPKTRPKVKTRPHPKSRPKPHPKSRPKTRPHPKVKPRPHPKSIKPRVNRPVGKGNGGKKKKKMTREIKKENRGKINGVKKPNKGGLGKKKSIPKKGPSVERKPNKGPGGKRGSVHHVGGNNGKQKQGQSRMHGAPVSKPHKMNGMGHNQQQTTGFNNYQQGFGNNQQHQVNQNQFGNKKHQIGNFNNNLQQSHQNNYHHPHHGNSHQHHGVQNIHKNKQQNVGGFKNNDHGLDDYYDDESENYDSDEHNEPSDEQTYV